MVANDASARRRMIERAPSADARLRARSRRYSRHLLVPEIALNGQERISDARILCIGAGGLGSASLAYLAAAGAGTIGIIDDDTVDISNLQRQTLFTQADLGRKKAEVAAERLYAQNPECAIDVMPYRFTPENALQLVAAYDVILDGSDSFSTRYLVNDACVISGRANVFASIYRFVAQCTIFAPSGGPCYRCIYPDPPPELTAPGCAEGGVLGAIAGIAGSWQAAQALTYLAGAGTPGYGALHIIDMLGGATRRLQFRADPACIVCAADAPVRSLDPQRYRGNAGDGVIGASDVPDIAVADVDAARAAGALFLDVREAHEAALGEIPDAVHIPFSQLDARLFELDPARRYIVACRVGARSSYAAARLRDAGFHDLLHLRAGILQYAVHAARFDAF